MATSKKAKDEALKAEAAKANAELKAAKAKLEEMESVETTDMEPESVETTDIEPEEEGAIIIPDNTEKSIKPKSAGGALQGGDDYEEDGKSSLKANSETKALIERFVTDLADMEVKKNLIQEQIKDLKNDYKEEGLPVALIVSLFKKVQKNKKKSDSERFDEETILEWLEESQSVDEACLKLTK